MKNKTNYLKVAAVVMLSLLMIPAGMVGCTSAQVNTVVTDINSYLPTVIAILQDALTIYGAVGAQNPTSAQVNSALTTVQADLKTLQGPVADYLAKASASGKTTDWSNIQAFVDTATADADALLQVAAVKNENTTAAGVTIIATLDAAVHVLDGYVSSAQTPAQVQAKAQARTVKLKAVSSNWSASDRLMVATQLGQPFGRLMHEAEAVGF